MTYRHILTMALAVMLVAGCGPNDGVASSSSRRDSPPVDEVSIADERSNRKIGEGTTAPSPPLPYRQAGLYFPHGSEPASMSPQALGGGTLFVKDGCIRMGTRGDSWVVVWPYGYSLQRRGGEVLILNSEGETKARVGDRVRISGGETSKDEIGPNPEAARRNFEERRRQSGVPDQCRGPLWGAGPVVRATGRG